MQCGLLGRKLGHSYSPQIHAELGSYPYKLYEKELEDLKEFLEGSQLTGLNVTIPYKKDVIPYCSELSDAAMRMGAVNTIIRTQDGRLIGHNTDYFGFLSMLQRTGLQVKGKKALVLGSGGASNTAVAVLRELGAVVVVISRSGKDHYGNLGQHRDAALIVNATPVGMYPNVDAAPLSLSQFPALEGVLDMIYNPARTMLLMEAEERGLVAENGLWMLVAQAKESAEWFTGHGIADSEIARIHALLQKQMENIVLIGMPGCGKSTVGKLLAAELGKAFVDADAQIEKAAGCSIPEIFEKGGEPLFRTIEQQVLGQLGKQSATVIATGGGCVTVEKNYANLHRNGRIIWLQRELQALDRSGRPLSQKNSMEELYRVRQPLYARFADLTADNNGNVSDTIQAIRRLL